MARYYNKTSTPLSFSFGTHSAVAPAHQWITVPDELEGSASLVALVAKKQLMRVATAESAPASKPRTLTEPAASHKGIPAHEVVLSPVILTEVPAPPSGSSLEEEETSRGGAGRRKGGKS
jgi:hypothetical protein